MIEPTNEVIIDIIETDKILESTTPVHDEPVIKVDENHEIVTPIPITPTKVEAEVEAETDLSNLTVSQRKSLYVKRMSITNESVSLNSSPDRIKSINRLSDSHKISLDLLHVTTKLEQTIKSNEIENNKLLFTLTKLDEKDLSFIEINLTNNIQLIQKNDNFELLFTKISNNIQIENI